MPLSSPLISGESGPTECVTAELVWLEHGRGLEPPAYQSALSAGMDLRAAITAPLLLATSFYGARAYKRVSERGFARLVLVLICVSGVTLAVGAARALWRF